MIYPEKGTLNRFMFKTPLIWWRMGLGPLLSHQMMGGSKMLLITAWGRKSGKPRHTMLTYVSVNEMEYVCSGWGARSDWYKNIMANPGVTVQVGNRTYIAEAYRVEAPDEFKEVANEMFETGGDSHFKPWLESYGIKFNREDMINNRKRLHIVGFKRGGQEGPPELTNDLVWVWGVIILILGGVFWIIF